MTITNSQNKSKEKNNSSTLEPHEELASLYPDKALTKKIPLNVWEDEELSSNEILLFSLVWGLAQMKAFCWASDQKLAQMLPKNIFSKTTSLADKARSVRRWLLKLKKRNHLHIYSEKKGFIWWRRIYTSDTHRHAPEFSKNVYEGIPESYRKDPGVRSDRIPESYPNYSYYSSKNNNNTNTPKNGENAAVVSSKKKEIKDLDSNLKASLTSDEVDRAYKYLNTFTDKKIDSIDNLAGYLIKGIKKDWDLPIVQETKENKTFAVKENNIKYSQKINELISKHKSQLKVHIGDNYVEFSRGNWSEYLDSTWSPARFQEEMKRLLKKTGMLGKIEKHL